MTESVNESVNESVTEEFVEQPSTQGLLIIVFWGRNTVTNNIRSLQ